MVEPAVVEPAPIPAPAPGPYRIELPAISADGRTLALDHSAIDDRERIIDRVEFVDARTLARRRQRTVATSYWEPTAADRARQAALVAWADAELVRGGYRSLIRLAPDPAATDPLRPAFAGGDLRADYDLTTGALRLIRPGRPPRRVQLARVRIRCAPQSPVGPAPRQFPWWVAAAADPTTGRVLIASGFPDDHGACGAPVRRQTVRVP